MKTYSPKSSEITRSWHLFDAKGAILGRLSTQIAKLLIGKHKTNYAPHFDAGDNVVVINAAEIAVSGNKETQKLYRHHSGYPGGMKVKNLALVRETKPTEILLHSVSGMLPKNKLQAKMLKHLHIYAGSDHPYGKQFKQN